MGQVIAKETMAEDFPELMKSALLQIQEGKSQKGFKTGGGRTPKTKRS